MEIDLLQLATHPATLGSGGTGVFLWLANKVYRGMGHRIASVEQAQSAGFTAAWKEIDRHRDTEAKLFDQMREHEQADMSRFERMDTASRDRHDEIMTVIGDLRTDIAGLQK